MGEATVTVKEAPELVGEPGPTAKQTQETKLSPQPQASPVLPQAPTDGHHPAGHLPGLPKVTCLCPHPWGQPRPGPGAAITPATGHSLAQCKLCLSPAPSNGTTQPLTRWRGSWGTCLRGAGGGRNPHQGLPAPHLSPSHSARTRSPGRAQHGSPPWQPHGTVPAGHQHAWLRGTHHRQRPVPGPHQHMALGHSHPLPAQGAWPQSSGIAPAAAVWRKVLAAPQLLPADSARQSPAGSVAHGHLPSGPPWPPICNRHAPCKQGFTGMLPSNTLHVPPASRAPAANSQGAKSTRSWGSASPSIPAAGSGTSPTHPRQQDLAAALQAQGALSPRDAAPQHR